MRHHIEALGSVVPDSGTTLIFGGVTSEGFDKARKLADRLASLDRPVVWFDGYPGDKQAHPSTNGLFVIDYGERERNRRLNRLERTNSGRFLARGLKRWNTATRGYLSWRLIRGEVLALSDQMTPTEIVFCDDHALTSAWHAARLWPETLVTRVPTS